MIAKYFASRSGTRHSTNAVQIMGALGCNDNYSISRCFRDSKTMEIVEGVIRFISYYLVRDLLKSETCH